jgi:hypothetical protein
MIRCVARYNLATDDFDAVDEFGDRVMDALTLNGDVLEPDVAISLTDRTLEILLLVDTNDALDAIERGSRAIQTAFAAADQPPVDTKVMMHRELIGPEAALRTELVSA